MGLFGLAQANRDFQSPANWKKNIFNNAFPVALACWMGVQGLQAVYLRLATDLTVARSYIEVETLFGLRPLSPSLHFDFESLYTPYVSLLAHPLPRIDLVTFDTTNRPSAALRSLEIKLTALPDNTTAGLPTQQYGCEIVVRPDSIVYIALSIASSYVGEREQLLGLLEPVCAPIKDWQAVAQVRMRLPQIADALNRVMLNKPAAEQPLVLQPVWRTVGQRLVLDQHCFDLFVWSNYAFTRLFMTRFGTTGINRPARSVIWLAKMLYDFAREGRFNARETINSLTYGPKNDKAFAVTGAGTHPLMACAELSQPRVQRNVVREIILGGGHNYLQPERRLDAAILTTPDLLPLVAAANPGSLPIIDESPDESPEADA